MPPKFASNLGSGSDSESGGGTSSSSSGGSEGGRAGRGGGRRDGAKPNARPACAEPTPDELAALGFDGGRPLAGAVPEPTDPGATAWEWGTTRRAGDAAPPDDADRAATVAAAAAIDDVALVAAAEAARRRAEALGAGSRGGGGGGVGPDGKPLLSHKQREKRKRDAGMQGGGHKNYVEEEKRVAREMGADGG